MPGDVPPSSDGGPPSFDGIGANIGATISGKRQALLQLEQIKAQIGTVEAWIQTVPENAGTATPPATVLVPAPPPPPPVPISARQPAPQPKKHERKHRRH